MRHSIEHFNLQIWNQELNSSGSPNSPTETLSNLDESSSVAFYSTNRNHDNVSIREELGCMGDSVMNFLGPLKQQEVDI